MTRTVKDDGTLAAFFAACEAIDAAAQIALLCEDEQERATWEAKVAQWTSEALGMLRSDGEVN